MSDERSRSARLIALNVLVDAFVTSFLFAVLGFLAVENLGDSGGRALFVAGGGVFAGVALSLFVSSWADRHGVRRALSLTQAMQVASFVLLGVAWGKSSFLVALGLVFALGRVVSPLRGGLPPAYLGKEELLAFKTRLRTLTLCVALVGAGAAAGLATVDVHLTSVAAGLGVVSYLACLVCTNTLGEEAMRPAAVEPASWWRVPLSREAWTLWLELIGGLAIAATFGAMAPFVVAHHGNRFAWMLVAAAVVGIAVNGVLATRASFLRGAKGELRHRGSVLGMGYLLAVGAVGSLFVASHQESAVAFALFFLIGAIACEIAELLLSLVAWDVQYSVGADERRTAIVAWFALGGSLAGGLGRLGGGRLLSRF